ncbi:MAG: glucosidase, partial [Spirosomaceae bacterium]|nr:glucosidase [Spirosomataceae bacterium]
LNMLRISCEIALERPVYQDMASKFFEHFLHISVAVNTPMKDSRMGLWDEADQFYYDKLHAPDGNTIFMKIRSIVGLIPLAAVEVIDDEMLERLPDFKRRVEWILNNRPDLASLISRWHEPGKGATHLLSLLRGHRMKMVLKRMFDETEFLSDELSIMGGNSNWRGPIWFPINFLLIDSLLKFYQYYGDDFEIEYPTDSGNIVTIKDAALMIAERLINIFKKNDEDRRPVMNGYSKFDSDEYFKNYYLFYEYFHGDNGSGLGAAHQTGWTGLVADLIEYIHVFRQETANV